MLQFFKVETHFKTLQLEKISEKVIDTLQSIGKTL